MHYLYFEAKRFLWPKRLKNFSLFSTFIKLHINYKRVWKLEFSYHVTVKKLLLQECNVAISASNVCHVTCSNVCCVTCSNVCRVTCSNVCCVTCSSNLRSYKTKKGSFVNVILGIDLYVGNFCVLCVNCVHNNLTIIP